MTAHHVLLSTDGPFDNVIKIKPPMCFSAEDAEELLHAFQDILLDQLPPRLAQLLELDRMAAEAREAQAALKRKLEDVMRSGGVGGTGTPLSGAASKATPGGADARPGKPEHAPHHVTGPGDSEPRLVPAAGARWWHELEPYGSSLKAVVGLGVGLGLMVSVLVALKRK